MINYINTEGLKHAIYSVSLLNDDSFDGGDLAAETADGGGLSLREAIGLANAREGADEIVFDLGLFNSSVNIEQGVEAFELPSGDNVISLTQGELVISDDLSINGDLDNDSVANIAILGNIEDRVLSVTSGNIDINGVGFFNGFTSLNPNAEVPAGFEALQMFGFGGGILVESKASLTLTNGQVISDNNNRFANVIYNQGYLRVENSLVSSLVGINSDDVGTFSQAQSVFVNSGEAVVIASDITASSSAFTSGVTNGSNGKLTLIGSSISDHSSTGLSNTGDASIINSVIANNRNVGIVDRTNVARLEILNSNIISNSTGPIRFF